MLRVIAGRYKGHRIKEVPTANTRPTTDKNKEMIFNVLGQFFDGGRMLDLYAGSGAIGIEALSRGMDACVFVDNMYTAVKTIDQNCRKVHVDADDYHLYHRDGIAYLRSTTEGPFDLIFADPPYAYNIHSDIVRMVAGRDLLSPQGILVIESDKNTEIHDVPERLTLLREIQSGITKFSLYKKEVIS
jgi:16S rRNA (guanine(966)-N(2))-methyltransferase RsmD